MPFLLLQFGVSATVIVLAARWLTRASDDIARLTGLGRVFVGGLFLAASTSAPELFVDIEAVSRGMPNLAAGDLLGSSLVNLSIFSGLFLVFRPKQASFQVHAVLRLGLLAGFMTLQVGLLILFKPPGEFLSLHWGSYGLLLTYLAGIRLVFPKQVGPERDAENLPTRKNRKLGTASLRFLIAATVIFFAAPLLIASAEALGQRTGLSNSFIGTTFVALTTSLPELASAIVAARMGLFDMVPGNIVGSNAFNMLIFVVMDGVWGRENLWKHFSVMHSLSAGLVILCFAVLGVAGKRPQYRLAGVIAALAISATGFVALYFFGESLR